MDFKRPSITQIGILFSAVILLFLSIGYRVQEREFYSGILITEFLLILLPALVFLFSYRFDVKKVLRFNKTSFLNFVLIFFIMLFAIPVAGVFNFINLWIVNSIFGRIILVQPPAAENVAGLAVNILVIGLSPAICEELLFRGVIQRGFERFGAGKAILLAAFLFGLTHLDFQKLFGTMLLGALIGFIVYRTNSLFGGMLAHFTNNSTAVLLGYLSAKLLKFMKDSGLQTAQQPDLNGIFSTFAQIPGEQLIIVLFIYGFIFLIFLSIFISLLFAFCRLTRGKYEKIIPARTTAGSGGLLWLIPGVSFVAGIYLMEVSKFTGNASPFIEQVRRLLGV